VEELIEARKAGYEATILFVIQMEGVTDFSPNDRTQPEFRAALRAAQDAGVEILAYDCIVTEQGMVLNRPVPVKL
jgi:sugar fermentation stimulation protein A